MCNSLGKTISLLLLVFAFLPCPPSGAQLGNSGSIEGVVTDPSGAAVDGAQVRVSYPVSSRSGTEERKTPRDVLRFEVTDRENNRPVAKASVIIVEWWHEKAVRRKKEMESETDQDGIAVFPKLQVETLAVTVEAHGYRSAWRWIDPKDFDHPIRIRLEKRPRATG